MTGHIHDLLLRISRMTRVSPFGIVRRKPEPSGSSDGTCVSSAYSETEPAMPVNIMKEGVGGPPTGNTSLAMCNPSLRVELVTNPVIFARTDLSAETNHATTGIRSVTNRCMTSSASLGEIMLSLMEEECGQAGAQYWCARLGFIS